MARQPRPRHRAVSAGRHRRLARREPGHMMTPCPCGPGSPPRSFSSMRNLSAASFASPSTTSPTTRPPSPSSWGPAVPLPKPVADLMRAYIQSRPHLPYASSRSAQWLFPGRQAGQPMNPVSLQVHLREIGVPSQRGRTSAIRQLALQVLPRPSPSRRHSATTTRPPPGWSPRPAVPGVDTRPEPHTVKDRTAIHRCGPCWPGKAVDSQTTTG